MLYTLTNYMRKKAVAESSEIPPVGKSWFVDSVNGASTNSGKSWDYALATINQAVAKCTANAGDTIYVAPWHAETIAAAASNPIISVAGTKVIGVSNGFNKPTITITHVDGTFSVTGANVTVEGIKVVANVADVKVGMTIGADADGAVIDGCVFRDSAANKEFLVALQATAASTDLMIINNDILTTAAAGTANGIKLLGGHTGSIIANNTIYGKFSAGAVLASAVASLGIKVIGNKFVNAEAALGLGLHASCTGILANNYIGGTTSIAAALTGETAMWCYENYVTGAAAASGLLDPAADSDGG